MDERTVSMSRSASSEGSEAPAEDTRSSPPSGGAEQGSIAKVHVIFKTHLDIGFTDFGERVFQRYVTDFVPRAIALAETMRDDPLGHRFRWTTGSWLIYKYLEEADSAARRRMEHAILAEEICWHALPFTMHSEALDASLFDLGIRLSKALDSRFGRNTTGAKMTDVPGHTRSIVPRLQAAGIRLLHIGVNPASTPPRTPQFFRWRAPDGSSVSVMYDRDYGGQIGIPGTSEAVSIILTGDNHGPPDDKAVARAYESLAQRYPGAELVPSDMSRIAEVFSRVEDDLPVITSELGDSWIHGIGSDAVKMSQLREMSRLRQSWIQCGRIREGSDLDMAVGVPLLVACEHTWGLDVKSHLQAWDVYTPQALQKARTSEPFRRMEASWQEKRGLIQKGVDFLPEPLRSQAAEALRNLSPTRPDPDRWESIPEFGNTLEFPTLSIALDPATGALIKLNERKTGREWASKETPLALFSYQAFSKADYDRFMRQYLTQRVDWALHDFGKPGIEKIEPVGRICTPRMTATWQKREKSADLVLAALEMVDRAGNTIPGCPRQLTLEYSISREKPVIDITLQWFDKAATRLPEAMWLSFIPSMEVDGRWMMDKMGQEVDPCDVVVDGGHKLHAVGKGVSCSDGGGRMMIETLDAPLVAPGERNLLNFDNAKPVAADGMHFCLCNNVWGTNFVMWFRDDMRFRFRVQC